MGTPIPPSLPTECPDCCEALPDVLHGTASHFFWGNFDFDFTRDALEECKFFSPEFIVPPAILQFLALFCIDDHMLMLSSMWDVSACQLPGNHCDLPAGCVSGEGWTFGIDRY